MKYKLKSYSIWDCGKRVDAKGQPHQEDSIFPVHGMLTDADRLFILCDGMGGHDAGEVASVAVCEAMSRSILSAQQDAEGAFSEEDFNKALDDAFTALDAQDDSTSQKRMGTTMTLLKLHNGGCFIAHMGDSRVYHVRPGKTREQTRILFRTEDHSLVNELVKAGELTPEEARLSSQKNVITRAIQPHVEQRPKADIYTSFDIQPDDYFYLCSDGMLENMEDEQLCYFFSQEAGNDQKKVESLLKATQENRDNHSAIIVHILDVINPIQGNRDDVKFSTESKLLFRVREKDPVPPVNHAKHRKSNGCLWITALILALIAVSAVWYTNSKPAPKPKAHDVEQKTNMPSISKPIKANAPIPVEDERVDEKGEKASKMLKAVTNLINTDSTNLSNTPNTEPDKTLEQSNEGSEPRAGNNDENNPASKPQDIDNDNVTENGETI